jgi:2-polyprenyl-6-methoxyphenol hydroxylase-like FAD-dependent oxidoreductase
MANYEIIVVGGGLGGAAVATVMARAGARVLVVERETRFQDRIRGEFMEPWGVAETRRLGLGDAIGPAGHELPFLDMRLMGMVLRRDAVATTRHKAPNFAIYHPTLQEIVLGEAAKAGAEVRRGAIVRRVTAGDPPEVEVEWRGRTDSLHSRLVVAADGRSSNARTWCGFETRSEPDRYYIAGLMLEDVKAPANAGLIGFNPTLGQTGYLFPQGGNRARGYAVYPVTADFRLQGATMVPRFIDESIRGGAPRDYIEGARGAGPLASFISADHWVEHPYSGRVVLVGDAAGASDPIWGKGLSLTMRDARLLTDLLRSNDDWDAACDEYARQHDAYFGILHAVDNSLRELLIDPGLETDARRMRALALIEQDPTRLPDVLAGPDTPFDEAARRRMFGED